MAEQTTTGRQSLFAADAYVSFRTFVVVGGLRAPLSPFSNKTLFLHVRAGIIGVDGGACREPTRSKYWDRGEIIFYKKETETETERCERNSPPPSTPGPVFRT